MKIKSKTEIRYTLDVSAEIQLIADVLSHMAESNGPTSSCYSTAEIDEMFRTISQGIVRL